MTSFLRSVDAVYFSDLGPEEAQSRAYSNALAQRLMKTRDWEWQRRERSTSISTRLGPAIAVLLFNDFGKLSACQCYLLEKGIDRLGSFSAGVGRGDGEKAVSVCGNDASEPPRSFAGDRSTCL